VDGGGRIDPIGDGQLWPEPPAVGSYLYAKGLPAAITADADGLLVTPTSGPRRLGFAAKT
jgi:hypothetical protein